MWRAGRAVASSLMQGGWGPFGGGAKWSLSTRSDPPYSGDGPPWCGAGAPSAAPPPCGEDLGRKAGEDLPTAMQRITPSELSAVVGTTRPLSPPPPASSCGGDHLSFPLQHVAVGLPGGDTHPPLMDRLLDRPGGLDFVWLPHIHPEPLLAVSDIFLHRSPYARDFQPSRCTPTQCGRCDGVCVGASVECILPVHNAARIRPCSIHPTEPSLCSTVRNRGHTEDSVRYSTVRQHL